MKKTIVLTFIFQLSFISIVFAQKQKAKVIEDITQAWAAANNSQNISQLQTMYASSLTFYAIHKDFASCLKEKQAFFTRYPNYKISITNLDIDFYKGGIVRCNFVKNETWNNKAESPQQGYLLFKKIDGTYKIIVESDQRMDSQKGYVPPLGEKVQKSSIITYMLLGAGALLILGGIGFLIYKNNDQKKKLKSYPMLFSQQLMDGAKADLPIFSPEELKKDNGLAFEHYVVKNFDHQYFTLMNWRGDKYIDGIYPLSSLDPDLDFVYQDTARKESFAIECKWRNGLINNTVSIAEERQINNYRKYQQEKNYPVFIILGVGGSGSNPTDIFIIPLNELVSHVMTKENLRQYYRTSKAKFFLKIPAMRLQ